MGWLGAIGLVGFVAAELTYGAASGVRSAQLADEGVALAGYVALLLAAVTFLVIRLWRAWRAWQALARKRRVALVITSFAAVAFLYLFPAIVIALATSGSNIGIGPLNISSSGSSSGGSGWWEPLLVGVQLGCLGAVPALVVILPENFRKKKVDWRPDRVSPPWLAGFAAFATWLFIFLLHFSGLPTPGGVGVLAVTAFFAAVLLAPFYQFLARSCWQYGAAKVFNPREWWSAWSKARQEMRLAFDPGPPAIGARSSQTAEPQTGPGPSAPAADS
jgi:hypothetical protein